MVVQRPLEAGVEIEQMLCKIALGHIADFAREAKAFSERVLDGKAKAPLVSLLLAPVEPDFGIKLCSPENALKVARKEAESPPNSRLRH